MAYAPIPYPPIPVYLQLANSSTKTTMEKTIKNPAFTMLYFHGFASSGASGTVETLRKMLPSAEIVAPDIPVDPVEALPFLKSLTEEVKPDVIVGTSMGGMYAQQMRGYLRVCVNPAFNMSTASKLLRTGTFKFLNGRKDKVKEFRITKETIQHFNAMERGQWDGITPEEQDLCYGLFGIHDKLVNTYALFLKHYTHARKFDGEHQLNDSALRHALLPLLGELLGERLEQAKQPPLPDYMQY